METAQLFEAGRHQAEAICRYFLGEPNRALSNSRELRWGRKGSFALTLAGQHRGRWFDHERHQGGDPLDLIEREVATNRPEALKFLADFIGAGSPVGQIHARAHVKEVQAAEAADAKMRADKAAAAETFWRESEPLKGTPGEAYLRMRLNGHDLPADAVRSGVLRWHPSPARKGKLPAGCLGAVLGRMIDPKIGMGRGIQRLFIGSDGAKIEAKMLGPAGIIPLYPFEDITAGLAIAEGIETSLKVMQDCERGGFGFRCTWAALSAGGIRNFPILAGVEELSIFADNDAPDRNGRVAGGEAATACAQRWSEAGRYSRILMPPEIGTDFADMGGAV